jgi:hypothetical protein
MRRSVRLRFGLIREKIGGTGANLRSCRRVRVGGFRFTTLGLVLGWQFFHAMTLAGTTEDE